MVYVLGSVVDITDMVDMVDTVNTVDILDTPQVLLYLLARPLGS